MPHNENIATLQDLEKIDQRLSEIEVDLRAMMASRGYAPDPDMPGVPASIYLAPGYKER